MIPTIFKVYDSHGNYLRSFNTWKAAYTWKVCVMQRYDWEIREHWVYQPY